MNNVGPTTNRSFFALSTIISLNSHVLRGENLTSRAQQSVNKSGKNLTGADVARFKANQAVSRQRFPNSIM
jgi:hypothetical protein